MTWDLADIYAAAEVKGRFIFFFPYVPKWSILNFFLIVSAINVK